MQIRLIVCDAILGVTLVAQCPHPLLGLLQPASERYRLTLAEENCYARHKD